MKPVLKAAILALTVCLGIASLGSLIAHRDSRIPTLHILPTSLNHMKKSDFMLFSISGLDEVPGEFRRIGMALGEEMTRGLSSIALFKNVSQCPILNVPESVSMCILQIRSQGLILKVDRKIVWSLTSDACSKGKCYPGNGSGSRMKLRVWGEGWNKVIFSVDGILRVPRSCYSCVVRIEVLSIVASNREADHIQNVGPSFLPEDKQTILQPEEKELFKLSPTQGKGAVLKGFVAQNEGWVTISLSAMLGDDILSFHKSISSISFYGYCPFEIVQTIDIIVPEGVSGGVTIMHVRVKISAT